MILTVVQVLIHQLQFAFVVLPVLHLALAVVWLWASHHQLHHHQNHIYSLLHLDLSLLPVVAFLHHLHLVQQTFQVYFQLVLQLHYLSQHFFLILVDPSVSFSVLSLCLSWFSSCCRTMNSLFSLPSDLGFAGVAVIFRSSSLSHCSVGGSLFIVRTFLTVPSGSPTIISFEQESRPSHMHLLQSESACADTVAASLRLQKYNFSESAQCT